MSLSHEESELYDRQIRLWGSDTQAKLRTAAVLLLNFDQVSADIAKNLALSGMKLSIRDCGVVGESHVATVFLCRETDVGAAVGPMQVQAVAVREIAEMNTLTTVRAATGDIEAEVAASRCVVLSNASIEDAVRVNGLCRAHSVPFYYVLSQGASGGFFADLGPRYEYTLKGKPESRLELAYKPLAEVSTHANWPFSANPTPSFEACVSAVVAGEVSQDIVKVIAGVGEPVRNCFVYDMVAGNGSIKAVA